MNTEWYNCPKCGHKIFGYEKGGRIVMSIKCPSCKTIIDMFLTEEGVVYYESEVRAGRNHANKSAQH